MKKSIQMIISGYAEFIRNTGVLVIISFLFILLSLLFGYPLWYLATHFPVLYTITGISLLLLLAVSVLAAKLAALYKKTGKEGVLLFFVRGLTRLFKGAIVIGGVCSVIYSLFHGMPFVATLLLIVCFFVFGFLFFRKVRI